MPLLNNAKKALRSSKRKFIVNTKTKSQVKTALDSVKASVSKETIATAFSKIDKAVKRGVMHKNKAARLKSQIGKKTAK